ncbi:MAG: 50S ribosomal protein L22 [Candidatus Tectomicrobia bacterium]|uniref:Large ribosomal subunit protein uL22 n=1 Tax=Tectimicrobiota bacterium TaxID=2528274 RepID=A0A933GLM0_UNCTE|nr:50S ribosomal protein L22 [Candidatus Tectomicrobia bacterium]
MEAKAILRYSRMSPRKARLVIDLVRGRGVNEALSILALTPKRSARVIEKVVKSALANAEEKKVEDVDSLVISKAWVDAGPTLKRFMPRARGRATPIRKRTSHIAIVLSND